MSSGVFELGRKPIFWTVMVIVFAIIIIIFYGLVAKYALLATFFSPELKAETMALRFLDNPQCFAYEDEERVYPGVIDLTKFTLEQLENCYKTSSTEEYNFGFDLTKEDKSVHTNYYRHHDQFNLQKNVLVFDGSKFKHDTLIIGVQVKI